MITLKVEVTYRYQAFKPARTTALIKTYKSELGFSFKYPPHLSVVAEYEGGYRLYLVANDLKPEDNTFSAIIISVANNNPTLTPKEWLNSSMSGYNKSNPYYRTEIDGEPATYTDGGMWFVVNTPDNKKRLSIASLRAKNGELLFSEMGILMESLTFDQ